MKEIYFHCYGCQDYNKHHRDDKNYEGKNERFDSLTDAIKHITETGHDMFPKLDEYDEEE